MLRHHKPIYQHPGGNQEDRFQKKKKGLGMLPRPRFADRARFELAEGCPSTVFKTVSLGRSDTCPDARSYAQVFIIQEGGIRLPFVVFDDNSPPPPVSYADSSPQRGELEQKENQASHLVGSMTSLPPM